MEWLYGGHQASKLIGGPGNDNYLFSGDGGSDILANGPFNVVTSGYGRDTIRTEGAGETVVSSGAGADVLIPGPKHLTVLHGFEPKDGDVIDFGKAFASPEALRAASAVDGPNLTVKLPAGGQVVLLDRPYLLETLHKSVAEFSVVEAAKPAPQSERAPRPAEADWLLVAKGDDRHLVFKLLNVPQVNPPITHVTLSRDGANRAAITVPAVVGEEHLFDTDANPFLKDGYNVQFVSAHEQNSPWSKVKEVPAKEAYEPIPAPENPEEDDTGAPINPVEPEQPEAPEPEQPAEQPPVGETPATDRAALSRELAATLRRAADLLDALADG